MRHRARNLDTEQPSDTQEEAEDAGDEASPHKHLSVPIWVVEQFSELREFSLEENEGRQQNC